MSILNHDILPHVEEDNIMRNACMYSSFHTLPFVQGTMPTIQEKLHMLYAM